MLVGGRAQPGLPLLGLLPQVGYRVSGLRV